MLKEYGVASARTGQIAKGGKPFTLEQTGLDIIDQPDEEDKRSLAEVEAFSRTDNFVKSTQQSTELAHKLTEENAAAVRDFRWAEQDELKAQEERIGRILHENDFFLKLESLIPIRRNDWTARGMRGFCVLENGNWIYPNAAVQVGYMTEYSIMEFDHHDLPVAEKFRGWRTVLLRLIIQGYLDEKAAHEVFGMPPINDASRRYRHNLWRYRNRGK
jgi:hypothetical protein